MFCLYLCIYTFLCLLLYFLATVFRKCVFDDLWFIFQFLFRSINFIERILNNIIIFLRCKIVFLLIFLVNGFARLKFIKSSLKLLLKLLKELSSKYQTVEFVNKIYVLKTKGFFRWLWIRIKILPTLRPRTNCLNIVGYSIRG